MAKPPEISVSQAMQTRQWSASRVYRWEEDCKSQVLPKITELRRSVTGRGGGRLEPTLLGVCLLRFSKTVGTFCGVTMSALSDSCRTPTSGLPGHWSLPIPRPLTSHPRGKHNYIQIVLNLFTAVNYAAFLIRHSRACGGNAVFLSPSVRYTRLISGNHET